MVAPEALAAWAMQKDDAPGLDCSRSPRPISFTAAGRRDGRVVARGRACRRALIFALTPGTGLVTVLDGSPGALSWLGGVQGHRVSPLGTALSPTGKDASCEKGDRSDRAREATLGAQFRYMSAIDTP